MTIKIVSWNIWIDGNNKEITTLLQQLNADIVGLQEVKDNDPALDVISFMKQNGYDYYYAPLEQMWDGIQYRHGPALFSKYPIQSAREYNLHPSDNRKLVEAIIAVGDKTLHVFSTHLTHTHQQNSDVQVQQVTELLKHIPKSSAIVMGDFNATPTSTTMQKVFGVLKTSDPLYLPTWCVHEAGCAHCLKKDIDTTLDYILTTSNIRTKSFMLGSSKGSDHLPVIAELEI